MQIAQSDYDRFLQLQAFQLSQSAYRTMYSCASDMNAFIASSAKPWVLDSGISPHMACIKDKFHFLYFNNVIPLSRYVGKKLFMATTSLSLNDVLYVPTFPVNFLFISKLATQNNCCAIFLSYPLCFVGFASWNEDWFRS